jgi:hypothetical protein
MSSKILSAALLALALALVACGGSDLSTEDAHDTVHRCASQAATSPCLDDSQKRAIAFANHFANVATACDGYGHRIWVTTRDQILIKPDPTCPGYTSRTPLGFGSAQDGG